MIRFPLEFSPDDNGTFLVTCPVLPEVTSFGDDEAEAMIFGAKAVEEALAARIAAGVDLPEPLDDHEFNDRNAPVAVLPTLIGIKLMLYRRQRDSGVNRADLARRLRRHREQVDRLFRLDHASRLDQLDAAFGALGGELQISAKAPRGAAAAGCSVGEARPQGVAPATDSKARTKRRGRAPPAAVPNRKAS